MKITGIKPILADGGHRIFVFVKIETDQPGLIGWGEASLEGKPRAVAGCIEDMEPMIAGEDPRRVEHCWQILYRSGFWRLGVIGLSALSGIDQALWDIKGKELGRSGHAQLRHPGNGRPGPHSRGPVLDRRSPTRRRRPHSAAGKTGDRRRSRRSRLRPPSAQFHQKIRWYGRQTLWCLSPGRRRGRFLKERLYGMKTRHECIDLFTLDSL